MSISSDLHKLAKFYADNPGLPPPSVQIGAAYPNESDRAAAIAAFVTDDAEIRSPSYERATTATIMRTVGKSLKVSMIVQRADVEAVVPDPPQPTVLSPGQIRARASVTQIPLPTHDTGDDQSPKDAA